MTTCGTYVRACQHAFQITTCMPRKIVCQHTAPVPHVLLSHLGLSESFPGLLGRDIALLVGKVSTLDTVTQALTEQRSQAAVTVKGHPMIG